MTVIQFPEKKAAQDKKEPRFGPRPIYVFAPTPEELRDSPRKLCLGYTEDEAVTRFYEGGLGSYIDKRVYTLATAPNWSAAC